jgi:hypothetical protein
MASALIQERGTSSGNQMRMSRPIEDAAQTFLAGTPLQLNNATGGLKAWDGVTIASGIAGIAKEFAVNLATAGVPLNSPAGTAPGALYVGGGPAFGAVQNEPAAVNLTRPFFNDGRTGIVLVITDTLFYAQVGPNQTTLITDIGKQYGMTKDVDGHWYVDKTKTGASAVCVVTGLDAWDTQRGVLITFLPLIAQILS